MKNTNVTHTWKKPNLTQNITVLKVVSKDLAGEEDHKQDP